MKAIKGIKDFQCYNLGLVCASVCSSLSLKEISKRLNLEYPTGIKSDWRFSNSKTFLSGHTNPCHCNTNPKTHKHYLFSC